MMPLRMQAFFLAVDVDAYNRANWISLAGQTACGVALLGLEAYLLVAKLTTRGGEPAGKPTMWFSRFAGSLLIAGGAGLLIYSWFFQPRVWL